MTTFLIIVAFVLVVLTVFYRQTRRPARGARRHGAQSGGTGADGTTLHVDTDRHRGDCRDAGTADASDGGGCGGDGGGGD